MCRLPDKSKVEMRVKVPEQIKLPLFFLLIFFRICMGIGGWRNFFGNHKGLARHSPIKRVDCRSRISWNIELICNVKPGI